MARVRPELKLDPALDSLAAWPFPDSTDYFLSGSNHAMEIRALAERGMNVGVAIPDLTETAIRELEGLRGTLVNVFVDSGAFSEVKFGPKGPSWPHPIDDAEWKRRLAVYRRLATALGSQLYAVAPDQVANQHGTLERQQRYAGQMADLAALGANILVPVQKGFVPMDTFYRGELAVLLRDVPQRLHRQYYPSIPLKKDATSLADLDSFARALPCNDKWSDNPTRLHMLGRGVYSPEYRRTFSTVMDACPDARLSSDSVRIRAMVGTDKAPRAYDAAQKLLRRMGVDDPGERKRLGLHMALDAQDATERAEAVEAGWYDSELFGSAAEHRAWYASRAGAPARAASTAPAQRDLFAPVASHKPLRLSAPEFDACSRLERQAHDAPPSSRPLFEARAAAKGCAWVKR